MLCSSSTSWPQTLSWSSEEILGILPRRNPTLKIVVFTVFSPCSRLSRAAETPCSGGKANGYRMDCAFEFNLSSVIITTAFPNCPGRYHLDHESLFDFLAILPPHVARFRDLSSTAMAGLHPCPGIENPTRYGETARLQSSHRKDRRAFELPGSTVQSTSNRHMQYT